MPQVALSTQRACKRSLTSLAFACAAFLAAPSFAAPVVLEIGDAGQTQSTAQQTQLAGEAQTPLTDIYGTLSTTTDADLYLIDIFDVAAFMATTVNAETSVDTQLFLLTPQGRAIYLNDDANGTTFQSTLPAGSPLGPITAGRYLLGISVALYDPINVNGQLLFADDGGVTTTVRGPAAGVSPNTLADFANNQFFADFGPYRIQLAGAATAIPEPATGLLVLMAGAAGLLAQRRRRAAIAA